MEIIKYSNPAHFVILHVQKFNTYYLPNTNFIRKFLSNKAISQKSERTGFCNEKIPAAKGKLINAPRVKPPSSQAHYTLDKYCYSNRRGEINITERSPDTSFPVARAKIRQPGTRKRIIIVHYTPTELASSVRNAVQEYKARPPVGDGGVEQTYKIGGKLRGWRRAG